MTALLPVLLTTLSLLPSNGRQPLPPPSATPPPSAAAHSGNDFADLLVLQGADVKVLYSPDSLDRAAHVQMHLEANRRVLSRLLSGGLEWKGMVLSHERWREAGLSARWGLPTWLPDGSFVMPARGDAASVALAHELLGPQLPDPGGDPLIGTRDEAASLIVSDLMLDLMTARSYLGAARIRGDEPWVDGVLLQLVTRYLWEQTQAAAVLANVGLFDRFAARNGGPRARRLDDYDDRLSFDADLWYQAQFVRGADAIWVAEGARGTARLLKKLSKGGIAARRADLEKKYPALLAWERDAFAP